MIPGGLPMGLGVDTLVYEVFPFAFEQSQICIMPADLLLIPTPGVFYLAADPPDELLEEPLLSVEPLHILYPGSILQVVVRASDSYTGYLFEMMNTPFIMTPRLTPQGYHQADSRLGCDCAGLAVYGRRRMGFDIPYAGPSGILRYLTPVFPGQFTADSSFTPAVYRSEAGESVPVGSDGLRPGHIIHFGSQVSVFLEDRGEPEILDSEDLVIQSWYNGTSVCTIAQCGFYGLPLRLYRWAEHE